MSRSGKSFEPGQIVEVNRHENRSGLGWEPATYDSICDTISSREGYHRVTLPDSAPPMYMIHGIMFDTPGRGRVETRRLLVPSRRIRKAKK